MKTFQYSTGVFKIGIFINLIGVMYRYEGFNELSC